MATVLFVCTGNLCRSPTAEWFLADRLSAVGPPDVTVESAGTMGTVSKVPAELEQQGARHSGLDLGAHLPRRVTPERVARASMVIGMERSHLREIVLASPLHLKGASPCERSSGGEGEGAAPSHQSLAEWLELLGAGRRHVELLGDSPWTTSPTPWAAHRRSSGQCSWSWRCSPVRCTRWCGPDPAEEIIRYKNSHVLQ